MWPSLVMYSMVSYWAILKVAWYGKKVCGHDPSSKEGLKGAQQISEDSADASTAVGDVSEASRA